MTLQFPRHRLAAIVAGVALGATASTSIASHSWGYYHWARTANPFTIKLGDNVGATWDPHLATTSADWSQSSVLNTTIVPGQATKPRNCRATTGMVEVCSTTYGNNGWLGVATISISGSHITAGTVKLNDTYFNTATYNTPAWRNLVMCQEVGHAFGLSHQDENFSNANLGSCMDYTNDPGTNQHPNTHDYEQLEAIYAHVDGTTTVAKSANGSAAFDADDDDDQPQNWGVLVRQSRDGRTSVYELDHGNGRKIVRHVIWALELSGKRPR